LTIGLPNIIWLTTTLKRGGTIMMESYILIAGLILFSCTVTYDLHKKTVEAQKANAATTQQVDKGFFDQDKRK